jgi:hypothetical protein
VWSRHSVGACVFDVCTTRDRLVSFDSVDLNREFHERKLERFRVLIAGERERNRQDLHSRARLHSVRMDVDPVVLAAGSFDYVHVDELPGNGELRLSLLLPMCVCVCVCERRREREEERKRERKRLSKKNSCAHFRPRLNRPE